VRDLLAARSTHSDKLEIKHNDKSATTIPGLLERGKAEPQRTTLRRAAAVS
jgi:hypothetical protein